VAVIGAEALNELLSDFISLPIGGPMAINPRRRIAKIRFATTV
jgi:hypothetical protein